MNRGSDAREPDKNQFYSRGNFPRLMGRVDIARYANGAKIIENAVCVVQGGVVRRPVCALPLPLNMVTGQHD